MARKLKLEVQPEYFAELLGSHKAHLTNEDLQLLGGPRESNREKCSQNMSFMEVMINDLEELIAEGENMMAYWEMVDSNFEKSAKISAELRNIKPVTRKFLYEGEGQVCDILKFFPFFQDITATTTGRQS